MQEMIHGISKLSKIVKQLAYQPDSEELDNDHQLHSDDDGLEPAVQNQCLDVSVSNLLSSASGANGDSEKETGKKSDHEIVDPPAGKTATITILDNVAQELQMEAPCAPRLLDKREPWIDCHVKEMTTKVFKFQTSYFHFLKQKYLATEPLLLEINVPVRTQKFDDAVAFALRFPNSLLLERRK